MLVRTSGGRLNSVDVWIMMIKTASDQKSGQRDKERVIWCAVGVEARKKRLGGCDDL